MRSQQDAILYLADGSVRLRVVEVRAAAREVEVEVEIGGAVASRQGLNIPGPRRVAAVGARGGPRAAAPRRVDRRGHGRAVVRAAPRGRRIGARPHAPAADRQDGEAPGGGARRGDPESRRLRDGRARRPRHRAADRARADRAEAAAGAGRLDGATVDHRDADARLDGRLLAPDPRRGGRRGERDPRRHRRGDALPGDGDRRLPGRGGGDDGGGRRAGGVDRPVRALERLARAPHGVRSRLHDRAQPVRRRARAAPGRADRPDAVRALGAPGLRASPDGADLRALARQRDGQALRPDVGRAGGVDARATRRPRR